MRTMTRNTGWLMLATCLVFLLEGLPVRAADSVTLRLRLRNAIGTAVTGEAVTLQRFPGAETVSPDCVTDAGGECRWLVTRGLYQVLFARPLDEVTTLALAEGGLTGFGLTVGETDITYHFTFHSDGRVYFDAAPEAASPIPVIPEGDSLHGGTVATPTTPATSAAAAPPASEDPARLPDTAVPTSSGSPWRLLLFAGGGLALGGGLHLWSRRQASITRSKSEKSHA